MNVIQTKAHPSPGADLMLRGPVEPVLCTLPDFVKVPPVPGLPTELTGSALRNALQARLDSGVSVRRR